MIERKTITHGIFDVTFRAVPEQDIDIHQHFNAQDAAAAEAEINAGVMQWMEILVTASLNGVELGFTGLGGCLYRDLADFMDNGGYVESLANEAVYEAQRTLKSLCAKAKEAEPKKRTRAIAATYSRQMKQAKR